MRYLTDRYRPELHYMRGPGPKWLEKHAGHAGALVVQGEGHQVGVSPLRRIELSFRRWLPTRWRASQGTWRNRLGSDRPALTVVGVSDVAGLPVSGLRPRGAQLPRRCSRPPL